MSTSDVGRESQPFDDFTLLQVALDDLVKIVLIDIAVPDALRVDHCDRSAGAAVETPCLVDAHAARSVERKSLHALLAVIECGLRVVLRTSSLAVAALVETKEDVVLVVGLGHAPILDQSPDRRSSAREINQAIAR
jgi:hypothetical protein